MISHKHGLRAFAALCIVLVVAMAIGMYTIVGTHAAAPKGIAGTPHFVHFTKNFADSNLATASLKHWSSSFSYKGKTYKYSMVGTNPTKGSATTTVATTIVPLKLVFTGGKSFDGTSKVSQTTGSPIFKSAQFISGNTQYGDAIQRAEFWNSVSTKSSNYHVLLGTPTIHTTVTLNVPAIDGSVQLDSSGHLIGTADINWFDGQMQSLLTSLHFTQNMLPVFLSDNTYLYQGTVSQCCIGGYHNATSKLQTYIWTTNSDAGVEGGFGEDVSAFSHELSEWLNDPFTNNTVPSWSVPSQPQYGCSSVLETGDPLVGVLFSAPGSTLHLQDEAFFSWFARQSPSIAINQLYTYLGTFTTYSPAC